MQRWLPECARLQLSLWTILLSALAGTCAGVVQSADFAIGGDPFESPTTMGPSVSQPDLLWQSTVKGFLSDTANPLQQAISNPAKQPVAAPAAKSTPSTTGSSAPSPFSKWITPRSSSKDRECGSACPLDSNLDRPTELQLRLPPDRTADSPKAELKSQTDRVPEIARRSSPQQSSPQQGVLRNRGRSIGEILNPGETALDTSTDEDLDSQSEAEQKATPLRAYPTPKAEAAPQQTPPKKLLPLTPQQKSLRDLVRRVLKYNYEHPLNTRDRSPWEIMHAALSYEIHSRVHQGGPTGQPVSAVGWLCFNQDCRKMKLMYVSDEGELEVRVGPALQGHRGQLLAILAQTRVSSEYPMLIDGHELKIKDLIKAEMKTCYPRTELTFKLIGLMHYLESDTQWVNDQGMNWNMRRLVAEELKQPIRGAACGGTHRLSGLTLSYQTRQARGEKVDGEYLQAQRFVAQHQLYAYRMQNPDGSFSTNWFQGPENKDDIDRKLKTTGHILEWLLYSATERELNSPRTTRAVVFLANLMQKNRYRDWESGPLGHAIHALLLYDRLMFSKYDEPAAMPVALRD